MTGMNEEDIIKIGDARWRKIKDCDDISDGIKSDVIQLKTDVSVVKALLKGIFAVAAITAAFLIPACLTIIMGVSV